MALFLHADLPQVPMSPVSPEFSIPAWADDMLSSWGLARGGEARVIYERANTIATRLAPNTRRLWRSILLLEGIAVLLPLGWLLVGQRNWPAGLVSGSVALCTVAVVGVCWWLRWRNQQQSWSRSRLLAEIARSMEATAHWPGDPTRAALVTSPSLQPLVECFAPPGTGGPATLDQLKQEYLEKRIDDQAGYYRRKAEEAARDRRRLSRYVTRSLDGALFLAVLGLWLGSSGSMRWLLSVFDTDLILGLAGAALPLTAILMQSLSVSLELNRRAGRYAQQWEFLQASRRRLEAAATLPDAVGVVREVEQALLAEVTEWFYQAEHSEAFYRTTNAGTPSARLALTAAPESVWSRGLTRVLEGAGLALSFTGRIIFGRLLIAAVASVLTTLVIFSRAPQDVVQRSLLRTADGQLLSKPGPFGWWKPKPEEAARGFVLIAHGLHDTPVPAASGAPAKAHPDDSPSSSSLHWMSALQRAVHQRLDEAGGAPDICLVDWSLAARPSEVSSLLQSLTIDDTRSPLGGAARFVTDVTAIRTQAQAIGDTVGYKLAAALKASPPLLHRDRPMHLIGHSAGGFLVVRAALVLHQLGLLPEHSRVTLLDTPLPDVDDLRQLLHNRDQTPSSCQIDFYKSSAFAQGVPEETPDWPNYRCRSLTPVPPYADSMTGAHSYAHQWFIQSVGSAPSDAAADGFQLSPLLPPRP
jgi:hypothetical protein